MAADLFRSDEWFRSLVKAASATVGEDLEKICLRGPDKLLRRSRILQPLIVAISLGYHRHLNLRTDVMLGHSLGEVSMLGAAGVIAPEEAVLMAAKRGALMDAAAQQVRGGMLAVTTTHREQVLQLLDRPDAVLANDNTPHQFVLSGSLEALEDIGRRLTHDRLGRATLLPVDGPWHSPFMTGARDAFAAWATAIHFRPPSVPLIPNATGVLTTDPAQIKQCITDTLAGPVCWRSCMETLRAMHPRQLFEIGPGRILAGLARANGFGDNVRVFSVNNLRGVAAVQVDGGGK